MRDATPTRAVDSLVLFRNSQGIQGRGTLVQVSRHAVIFEVYNPHSVVQLSEVLESVQIRRGEAVIYEGRAVVSALTNTGFMVLVSVRMIDPWPTAAELTLGARLREEAELFVDEWELRTSSLEVPYVAVVAKVANFCRELSRWLAHSEMAVGLNDTGWDAGNWQDRFVHDIASQALPTFKELLNQFEQRGEEVPEPTLSAHKEHVRRELHPLILCSPFIHRTYTKPLGYAGDYEMVNMMFRDPWEGSNPYARIVNAAFVQTETAQGHRNRVARLVECLKREAERCAQGGATARILNVGCGPVIEIQHFVRQSECASHCQFDLVDFNEQTLDYARRALDTAMAESGRYPGVRLIHESIHTLLKRASGSRRGNGSPRSNGPALLQTRGEYDLIYCAGLFDYLSNRICQRLLRLFVECVVPGGLVVATNVHPSNPRRQFMEHVVEWNLIHRDEATMLKLAPGQVRAKVTPEQTGNNIFLELRRPID